MVEGWYWNGNYSPVYSAAVTRGVDVLSSLLLSRIPFLTLLFPTSSLVRVCVTFTELSLTQHCLPSVTVR